MYAEWESKVNHDLEELLKQSPPENGNGRYYEALGNAFLALEQEPDAVWAYEKALSLAPWDSSARQNLATLQEKLALPHTSTFSLPLPVLYPSLALLFILLLVTWRWKKPRLIFAALSTLTFITLATALWILPLHGVLLHSSHLLQAPAKDSPRITKQPLPSGLKIEVLDTPLQGTWLKVKDLQGNIGYVPYESLRVL